jgi:hypothetical protein
MVVPVSPTDGRLLDQHRAHRGVTITIVQAICAGEAVPHAISV